MNRWLSACWKQRLLNNPILRSNSIFSPVCRNSVLGNWTRRRQTKVKSHLDALFNRFWSLKTSSNGWFPCSAKPIVYLIIHWVSSSQCPRERERDSVICLLRICGRSSNESMLTNTRSTQMRWNRRPSHQCSFILVDSSKPRGKFWTRPNRSNLFSVA